MPIYFEVELLIMELVVWHHIGDRYLHGNNLLYGLKMKLKWNIIVQSRVVDWFYQSELCHRMQHSHTEPASTMNNVTSLCIWFIIPRNWIYKRSKKLSRRMYRLLLSNCCMMFS